MTKKEIPQKYDPKEREAHWQKWWIDNGIYKFDPDSEKEVFSVDTPPPTVSGKMHIGHSFSFSQQDFIVRYKRMRDFNIFCPFGTDDNGLATERLVEKMKGVKGTKMPRDEFVKLCLETLEKELRPEYIQDWKRIGMSCDWDIFYTTLNKHVMEVSQRAFLDLVKKKRTYRKFAPIIFCPQCKTAIAQVEMEDVEMKTTLNYVKGEVETGEKIIYATTRPELHPACVGISIDENGEYATIKRPDGELWIISKDAIEKMKDEYELELVKTYKGKDIVGKKVTIAYAPKPVPITHDISAKTEYGTGIVYYCTYGGLDCVEWMARHTDVEPIHIMDVTGLYTDPSPYAGMNSQDARKQVLEDLENDGYLIKKEHMKNSTNVHERCQTPIEYVALMQWFIKYLDLKDDFIKRGNELNWFPPHMKNRYDNWINGLQWDWCISRQRFSGVPFPVWYDKKTGEPIFADDDQLPCDPLKDLPNGYTKDQVVPEEDILDTWATSSLTPNIAAELFKDKPIYEKLLPMDLRPQAHDIITFWLFNTVVRSHLHRDELPWKDVMISGWALDPHGRKMSKSKGNVVEPQVMIEKYSADALRFWAAGSKLGDDMPFQEKDLVTGTKMVTKMWNACKFAIMHLEDFDPKSKPKQLEPIDEWLLTKFNEIVQHSIESFDKYEYARTKHEVEKFFWQSLCDNYLEIAKDRLYNPENRGKDARLAAQYTLYHVILGVLKLMAPIMPHITEEIYQMFYQEFEGDQSIHIASWPTPSKRSTSQEIEAGDLIVDIIAAVRKIKSEQNLSLKTDVEILIISTDDKTQSLLEPYLSDLKDAVRAQSGGVKFEKGGEVVINENLSISAVLAPQEK